MVLLSRLKCVFQNAVKDLFLARADAARTVNERGAFAHHTESGIKKGTFLHLHGVSSLPSRALRGCDPS